MKKITSIGALLVLLLLFIGCDENTSLTTNKPAEIVEYDIESFDFVGELHNTHVIDILQRVNESLSKNEIINSIYSDLEVQSPGDFEILVNEVSLEEQKIETNEIISLISSNDIYQYISDMNQSAIFITYFIEAVEVVEGEFSLEEMEILIEEIEEEAINNLSSDELLVFLSGTSVLKKSSELWYSEELGGLDASQYIIIPKTSQSKISWWKVITADALGAVGTAAVSLANSGGTSAAPICGGVPPAGKAAAVGGAVASAGSILAQY